MTGADSMQYVLACVRAACEQRDIFIYGRENIFRTY